MAAMRPPLLYSFRIKYPLKKTKGYKYAHLSYYNIYPVVAGRVPCLNTVHVAVVGVASIRRVAVHVVVTNDASDSPDVEVVVIRPRFVALEGGDVDADIAERSRPYLWSNKESKLHRRWVRFSDL